jgi:DNA invertase Pin-like site-specific DNA recombinase
MLIGYARVSREDQNLELQLQALKNASCDRIFSDKKSGNQVARKGLEEALSHLRAGDTLIVWKLDRLGRTVKQLVDLVSDLESRAINFKSLTDGIDTTTTAGRFFFQLGSNGAGTHSRANKSRPGSGEKAGAQWGSATRND